MYKFVARVLAVATLALAPLGAAAQPADTVLVNGKVVTVDQRFTIGIQRARAARELERRQGDFHVARILSRLGLSY